MNDYQMLRIICRFNNLHIDFYISQFHYKIPPNIRVYIIKQMPKKVVPKSKKAGTKKQPKQSSLSNVYQCQNILDVQIVSGQRHYLIKWKGYDLKDCTWEPLENLEYLLEDILEFQKNHEEQIKKKEEEWSTKNKGKVLKQVNVGVLEKMIEKFNEEQCEDASEQLEEKIKEKTVKISKSTTRKAISKPNSGKRRGKRINVPKQQQSKDKDECDQIVPVPRVQPKDPNQEGQPQYILQSPVHKSFNPQMLLRSQSSKGDNYKSPAFRQINDSSSEGQLEDKVINEQIEQMNSPKTIKKCEKNKEIQPQNQLLQKLNPINKNNAKKKEAKVYEQLKVSNTKFKSGLTFSNSQPKSNLRTSVNSPVQKSTHRYFYKPKRKVIKNEVKSDSQSQSLSQIHQDNKQALKQDNPIIQLDEEEKESSRQNNNKEPQRSYREQRPENKQFTDSQLEYQSNVVENSSQIREQKQDMVVISNSPIHPHPHQISRHTDSDNPSQFVAQQAKKTKTQFLSSLERRHTVPIQFIELDSQQQKVNKSKDFEKQLESLDQRRSNRVDQHSVEVVNKRVKSPKSYMIVDNLSSPPLPVKIQTSSMKVKKIKKATKFDHVLSPKLPNRSSKIDKISLLANAQTGQMLFRPTLLTIFKHLLSQNQLKLYGQVRLQKVLYSFHVQNMIVFYVQIALKKQIQYRFIPYQIMREQFPFELICYLQENGKIVL